MHAGVALLASGGWPRGLDWSPWHDLLGAALVYNLFGPPTGRPRQGAPR